MKRGGKLVVGDTVDGKRFTLPLELGTQTSAIVGIRGSGKTNTATVFAEELLERGHQVVVIDPTDAWWGLKSSADGKRAGFPVVVLGGPHSNDLPLEPGMGRAIADLAVEQRVPLILSLRHLRKGAQQTFVTEFCEQLYHRKGEIEHRTPLLVAIDEASAFVPQRVGGAEARMVGAIEDLVRRGRAAGLGVTLIDQRPASVNKDVLTQLEVLVAHRVTSPQDSKALREWIRQHDTAGHEAAFLDELPSLPQGSAWFWSPSLDVFERVHVRPRSTFDSSKTPKPGDDVAAPTAWAKVDLEGLRGTLKESIEHAAASDPKKLQARIRELEEQLRRKPSAAAPDPAEIERAVAEATRVQREYNLSLHGQLGRAEALVNQLVAVFKNGSTPPPALPDRIPAPREATAPTRPPPPPPPEGGISTPKQRILDAVLQLNELGIRDPSVLQVALFVGVSHTTGTFKQNVRELVAAGYLERQPESRVVLSAAGVEQAAVPEAHLTVDALLEFWYQKLTGPQAALLGEIVGAYPGRISREDLARHLGKSHTTGTFKQDLRKLRDYGLVEFQSGELQATELLFPPALPVRR